MFSSAKSCKNTKIVMLDKGSQINGSFLLLVKLEEDPFSAYTYLSHEISLKGDHLIVPPVPLQHIQADSHC